MPLLAPPEGSWPKFLYAFWPLSYGENCKLKMDSTGCPVSKEFQILKQQTSLMKYIISVWSTQLYTWHCNSFRVWYLVKQKKASGCRKLLELQPWHLSFTRLPPRWLTRSHAPNAFDSFGLKANAATWCKMTLCRWVVEPQSIVNLTDTPGCKFLGPLREDTGREALGHQPALKPLLSTVPANVYQQHHRCCVSWAALHCLVKNLIP